MQVRDGPAAVRGDARRGNATGRTGREGREGGAPSQKTCRAPNPEPLAEGGFVLRRLIALSVLLAVVLDAGRARGQRQDPGRRQDDRRSSAPRSRASRPTTRSRRSTPPASPASSTTALTTASFGDYVSQIGKYPAAGSAGWVFKVNGVSPPVGADKVVLKDGDVVLWYYATFGAAGGPPTLELQRLPANCYVVQSVNDAGKRARGRDRDARRRTGSASRRRRAAPASAGTPGSSARPRPARSARTPCK